MCVVYFDQLLGAARTQKQVETLKNNQKRQFQGTLSGSRPAFACRSALKRRQNQVFFCSFSDVFCWFQPWNHWKNFEMCKKDEKWLKKCFDQLLGACSTQKLVKIHNTWACSNYASKVKLSSHLSWLNAFKVKFELLNLFKKEFLEWQPFQSSPEGYDFHQNNQTIECMAV